MPARRRDPPLGLHLPWKRSQLFPLQAWVALGPTGPSLWARLRTLPIPAQLLRSVRATPSPRAATPWPREDTSPGFPPTGELCCLWHQEVIISASSVRSPWEGSQDRKGSGLSPTHMPSLQACGTLSSPKNRPVSVLC